MNAKSQNLVIHNGQISLPEDVIGRYQLGDETPVRIIETRGGILLVPITSEPMSSSLIAEIAEWQELSAKSLDLFPYEGDEP